MAIALPLSFLAKKSKSLGNEQSVLGGHTLSILRASKLGKDWRVSAGGFRLWGGRGHERENRDTAGYQRLCALAEWLKFINNYLQVPTAVCTWFHVTHMLSVINGCNSISMTGNAGLSKIREKQPKRYLQKSFLWQILMLTPQREIKD